MRLPFRPPRQRGLTLIELMVALAVFAVLGVLAWRGLDRLVDGSQRVEAELERWRAVGRAMQRVETDLLQIATPAAGLTAEAQLRASEAPPLLLVAADADGQRSELQLLTLVSEGAGMRRVAYRFERGELHWLRWPGRYGDGGQGGDTSVPDDVLLDGVRALRWRFIASNVRHETWPAAGVSRVSLPAAVELELDLDGIGAVRRVVALR